MCLQFFQLVRNICDFRLLSTDLYGDSQSFLIMLLAPSYIWPRQSSKFNWDIDCIYDDLGFDIVKFVKSSDTSNLSSTDLSQNGNFSIFLTSVPSSTMIEKNFRSWIVKRVCHSSNIRGHDVQQFILNVMMRVLVSHLSLKMIGYVILFCTEKTQNLSQVIVIV